jgi:hypothetical protein
LVCGLAQRRPALRSTAAGPLLLLGLIRLWIVVWFGARLSGVVLCYPVFSGCGAVAWFLCSRDLGCLLSFGAVAGRL